MADLSEIVICNMALSHLGVTQELSDGDGTIAGSADGTLEEQLCQLWYERCLNSVLESFSWPFARKYALLSEASDGTGKVWEDQWNYSYTYPSDCLRLWQFVTFGTSRSGLNTYRRFDVFPEPWPFEIKNDANAKVIMTDVDNADANVEYTKTLASTDVAEFPEQFARAVSYRLASDISMGLTGSNDMRLSMLELAFMEISAAAAQSANEEEQSPEGDSPFVLSRGAD